MDYKAKQDEFDLIKWLESGNAGEDFCGRYDFCACCVKDELHPCARAMERFQTPKTEREEGWKNYIRLATLVPVKE